MREPWDQYAQLQEMVKRITEMALPAQATIDSLRTLADATIRGLTGSTITAQAEAEAVHRTIQQLSAGRPADWDTYIGDLQRYAAKFSAPKRDIQRLIDEARYFVPPTGIPELGALRAFEDAHGASSLALRQLLDSFRHSGLLENGTLSNRILAPIHGYGAFYEDMRRFVERMSAPGDLRAVTGSLRLSEIQLLDSVGILEAATRQPTDGLTPSEPRLQPLHSVQFGELLAIQLPEDVGVSELATRSRSAGIAAKSRTLLRKVIECNETARLDGRPEVFAATTRGYEVFADLPQIVCCGKVELGQFVDCLFFLLYEGAGSDHLRFLKQERGVLDDNECDFVWRVKDLRSKWLRHDPDHGSPADRRKKWKDVGRALGRAGITGTPTEEEEFLDLQSSLLDDAIGFLKLLLTKLKKS